LSGPLSMILKYFLQVRNQVKIPHAHDLEVFWKQFASNSSIALLSSLWNK
jgi:hypothetical protein